MLKLLKRTAQAERQVLRRQKIALKNQAKKEKAVRRQSQRATVNEVNKNIQEARRSRHERWELGPIAPNREADPQHGLVAQAHRLSFAGSEYGLRPFEIERRWAWAGGSRWPNLREGDRVVIVQGRDKGRIDEIESIDMTTATVMLKNFNQAAALLPGFLQKSLSAQVGRARAAKSPLPVSAVRLVHPITDPETGVTRDVIIKHLARGNVRRDRLTNTTEWDRYVPGLNVIIPWPAKEDTIEEPHAGDTRRADVQEVTFVPTLLRPPMPDGLVNELRNQYSRFRTRHEAWYVAKKEAEQAEKKARHVEMQKMRTPLQEFHAQQREMRRARGQPTLTPDMLEKIGQVIARNRESALSLAGVTQVSSSASTASPTEADTVPRVDAKDETRPPS